MAAKAIAFINFKGGVGKTAATVNIGACLAYYRRKRVLIVDLDAQCNSSFWLMPPLQWKEHIGNGERSTYQLFRDAIMNSKKEFDFEKAVLKGMPRAAVPLIKDLDLLPAAVELIKVEEQLQQNKHAKFYEIVAKALKPQYERYDYILFDCPPNTYSVTKNALFAADYCVIPYLPDFLSLSGFQIFAKLVDDISELYSWQKSSRHKTSIAAVLVSHYRSGLKDHDKSLADLRIMLSLLKSQGLVHAKADLLEPPIRLSKDVAESTNQHQPVILTAPNSIGAADYHDLAKAFDDHFSNLP
ncbi:ParA family protein [Roseimicrobium sp. ORNL1]|uniref:ParA family protein n=1 Tax=Roseimicrobium sp. ORNL1 TaxID=2711231 RepID=UPI0013E1C8A8|nr:ParA family protein [Roseimicrobium sp. ORNL1]QIF03277.1 ParA family protein [Roseimicrobium sp. ORNL1]